MYDHCLLFNALQCYVLLGGEGKENSEEEKDGIGGGESKQQGETKRQDSFNDEVWYSVVVVSIIIHLFYALLFLCYYFPAD